MASFKYGLACALLVLFAFVQTGESIKCYECVACTDDGKEVTCPVETGVEYLCYLSTTDSDAEKWTRGCTKDANICKAPFTSDTCGTCKDDLCNDASSLASATVLTVCSLFLIKMFY